MDGKNRVSYTLSHPTNSTPADISLWSAFASKKMKPRSDIELLFVHSFRQSSNPYRMYLETFQSLCLFYDRLDPAIRDETTEKECWKCCMSRDPQILRLGGHWLMRCLVQFLPSFTISSDLYEIHRDAWTYLAAEFCKDMQVSNGEVDVGCLGSNIRPGGFLLTRETLEDSEGEWMHMVSAGSLHLWRKRCSPPWP